LAERASPENGLRVVAWNCARAFRKKAHKILALDPGIVVVPECEDPATCKTQGWLSDFPVWRWFGDNKHQGVGLFSCGEIQISECDWYDPEIKFIKPYAIKGFGLEFTIIPVWANNASEPKVRYVGQVWKFLEKYGQYLVGRDVLLLGDLNSNAIWDKKYRLGNHSDVVRVLQQMGIESLYHSFYNVEHGAEPEPTFYLYRQSERSYHLDYIFASQHLRQQLRHVQIGTYDEWVQWSDHCPIICTFDSVGYLP
jgi:exonuclease III